MRDFCSGERPFSWLLGEESDDISVGGGEKLFSWPPGGEMEALLAGGGEKDMHSSSRDLFIPADVKDFPSGLKNEEIFCPPASPF